MNVKGLNSGSVCYGVGFDGSNDICTKLCGLSHSCSVKTKEFLLRERDEIQRQKEGISQLGLNYDELNESKRRKYRKSLRKISELYAPDMPNLYDMTTAQLEALSEQRGLVITDAHLKYKYEKPHLYKGMLLRRVRATYKLKNQHSNSMTEYLNKLKGEQLKHGEQQ